MLSEKEILDIGRLECADMFGRDFVKANMSKNCSWMGEFDQDYYSVGLGFGMREQTDYPENGIRLEETPLDYYAEVLVNKLTGEVIRDYENSKLPN